MQELSEPSPDLQPAVSIILPTYNRARFLPQAIESIRSQEFTNWELIVVDDGSTDETPELIRELTGEISQRVRYIRQENQGPYGARNTGLDHATCDIIAFFDSDDRWLPDHLQDCVTALEASPDIDWVYDACRIIDHSTGEVLAPNTFYEYDRPRPFTRLSRNSRGKIQVIEDVAAARCQVLYGLYCGLQNSVIRRRVFGDFRFEAVSRNEAEDQLIVIDRLLAGYKFAYIDQVGVEYRVHENNSSAVGTNENDKKRVRVLTAIAAGFEQFLKRKNLPDDVRAAIRRRLGQEHVWHLGYATHWASGNRTNALKSIAKGIGYWPWDWRYWKTMLSLTIRSLLPSWGRQLWWYVSDGEYRTKWRATKRSNRAYKIGQRNATRAICRQSGLRVLSGPFQGLEFTPARKKSTCAHVLLGTYEKELHPIVEEICERQYRRIINIGASDGYYACGLALRNQSATVLAFEGQSSQHRLIKEMAHANKILNLRIFGLCDSNLLREILSDGDDTCIVCDIDGPEGALLNPQDMPGLRNCDVLVETHDLIVSGITELLLTRFGKSHAAVRLSSRDRTMSDAPPSIQLDSTTAIAAMDEHRGGPQEWLWLTHVVNRTPVLEHAL